LSQISEIVPSLPHLNFLYWLLLGLNVAYESFISLGFLMHAFYSCILFHLPSRTWCQNKDMVYFTSCTSVCVMVATHV